jgi:preprotein translocase subunit Sec61beta
MGHKTSPLGRIAMWAIGLLGTLFVVMIFMGKDWGIDAGLYITYLAFGIATVATLGFSLTGLTKQSMIGIGAFVALLVIAYTISDGSVRPEWNISEGTSKWIGAGLILFYVSMLGAIGAILYGEITRMLK